MDDCLVQSSIFCWVHTGIWDGERIFQVEQARDMVFFVGLG